MTTVIRLMLTGSIDRAQTPVLRRIKGEEIWMAPRVVMGSELIEPHKRAVGICSACGEHCPGTERYCSRCEDEIDALRKPKQVSDWLIMLGSILGFLVFCLLMAGLAKLIFG
jgi:predicted nucleic acid-binding Zn ribbon protein